MLDLEAKAPEDLLTEEVVTRLAALDPLSLARAFVAFRERWPWAGVWRDLRSAVTRERGRLARETWLAVPRQCRRCGAALPPPDGPGRPPTRCAACRGSES